MRSALGGFYDRRHRLTSGPRRRDPGATGPAAAAPSPAAARPRWLALKPRGGARAARPAVDGSGAGRPTRSATRCAAGRAPPPAAAPAHRSRPDRAAAWLDERLPERAGRLRGRPRGRRCRAWPRIAGADRVAGRRSRRRQLAVHSGVPGLRASRRPPPRRRRLR